MKRTPRTLDGLISAIGDAKSIAIASHISPDGDTVGSALALRLGLMALGHEVTLFCQDKVPDILHFLPGVEEFRDPATLGNEHFDLLLCVDISDVKRMGSCADLQAHAARIAQIDHHGTNTQYAAVNCVDGSAPANVLIVRELLERLGCTITKEIALCLAVGLSTDTAHLVYESTTPEAFYTMGDMVALGAPIATAYRKLYKQRPARQVRLLAKALASLQFHRNGTISSLHLTHEDFVACGALPEDAEIVVNYGLDIIGVRMAVFAREANEAGDIKLSLRAVAPDNVAQVALAFGGGGHAQAAGAMVHMPLEEAIAKVVDAMSAALERDE